jgi:hypothetical protein
MGQRSSLALALVLVLDLFISRVVLSANGVGGGRAHKKARKTHSVPKVSPTTQAYLYLYLYLG